MTGTGQVPFFKPVFGKHIVTADTYGRDNQRKDAAKGISARLLSMSSPAYRLRLAFSPRLFGEGNWRRL